MDKNISTYPDGYEKIKNEMLGFLPEDEQVRSVFMRSMLQWMIQW